MSKVNMGHAVSIIARQFVLEQIMHIDVNAFGAPSECHGLVSRGESRRARLARRHAKSVSGLSRYHFNLQMRRVTTRAFDECCSRLFVQLAGPLY